ncbi:GNAT family N-acetyltransferase [Ruegeria sp. A3M17]|uniref:GNAT family N-acetyltransferase n=1 Tax=Ruegeria sp. A3M17 TaxID=2267229 RepID=UPI000DE98FA8|nr:GNAT family N-acetyltransferase [Ruegeria sp. A3M17]RBW54975.1 hypothetical protein DS906_15775 [Ruegeria sp. A3M17]
MTDVLRSRRLTGLSFQLRPVSEDDAEYIVNLRSADSQKQKYLNPISPDVEAQRAWLQKQAQADQDYYFLVLDRFTQQKVGLIGLYDINDGQAEWGRWIIEDGSLAAIESVNLLMSFGFHDLGLAEIYCRTVSENTSVVKFHDGYAQRRAAAAPNTVELRGETFELVEHGLTKEEYVETTASKWGSFCQNIFNRRLQAELGVFEFHHIGIAAKSIESAAAGYRLVGYTDEARFTDPGQGVHGLFMTAKSQPRIELLENMEGSKTLDSWLSHSVAPYHFAYYVKDIETAISTMGRLGIRPITPVKKSVYFQTPIVFMVMPNRFIVELIEISEK